VAESVFDQKATATATTRVCHRRFRASKKAVSVPCKKNDTIDRQPIKENGIVANCADYVTSEPVFKVS
jgi:hypothetical protein